MLKSIQTRVTTLASILFFFFYFALHPLDDEFCRLPVQTGPHCEPNHTASLTLKADSCTIMIHLSCFPALAAPLMHFPCCCVSYSLQGKENPFLIIFLHHISPPLRSFPRHQQPHPENQFAQEAGLFNSGWGDWHLRDPPLALHFPLMP